MAGLNKMRELWLHLHSQNADASAPARPPAEPAPLPDDEQGVLRAYGPEYLKQYQQTKYRATLSGEEQAILDYSGPEALKQYQKEKAIQNASLADLDRQAAEARRISKDTGQIPKTKYPFTPIEIKEGRMMTRRERMDAMLKAQGKSHPDLTSYGNGEVDNDYLTDEEYKLELFERVKSEKAQCDKDHWAHGPAEHCKVDVDDKYGGSDRRAERQQLARRIDAVKEKIEGVRDGGAGSLVGRAGCAIAGAGQKVQEVCAAGGGAIGAVAGGVVAPVLVGKAQNARTSNSMGSSGLEVRRDAPVTTTATPTEAAPKPDVVPKEPQGSIKTPSVPQKPTTDPGLANTPPAPAPRPPQGHPLDSTPPVPKNQATVGTGAPGTPSSKGTPASHVDSPPKKYNTLEPRNLPANQQITINTSKGPKQMTVGEYRRRVEDAEHWIGEQRSKFARPIDAPPEQQLTDQAAEQFGLNKGWRSIDNPYVF